MAAQKWNAGEALDEFSKLGCSLIGDRINRIIFSNILFIL